MWIHWCLDGITFSDFEENISGNQKRSSDLLIDPEWSHSAPLLLLVVTAAGFSFSSFTEAAVSPSVYLITVILSVIPHTVWTCCCRCRVWVWVGELLPDASDIRLSLLLRGNELDDGPTALCSNAIEMSGLDSARRRNKDNHNRHTRSENRRRDLTVTAAWGLPGPGALSSLWGGVWVFLWGHEAAPAAPGFGRKCVLLCSSWAWVSVSGPRRWAADWSCWEGEREGRSRLEDTYAETLMQKEEHGIIQQ